MNQVYCKNVKALALTIILIIISSLLAFSVSADTDTPSGFTLQYRCGTNDILGQSDKAQSMRPYVIIYNNSGESVDLADLTVRYYYEKEGTAEERIKCFYAAIGSTNVTAEFFPEKGYADIGFTSDAGSIPDGGNSGQVQAVLEKVTTGYYDQTNDYSYNLEFEDYAEYDKITLYHKGVLVWGAEAPPPPPKPTPPPGDDDWLYVEGNQIKNKEGNTVYLTGINWFGFETDGANGFYGLNKCNIEESIDLMAERGFNILRIPISAEIIKDWQNGTYVETSFVSTFENPRLDGLNSLEILDYTIDYMKQTGMKVMLDMHGASKDSYQNNLWYDKIISMEDFVSAWKWIVDRYKDDDTVIAVDLKNEPHGKFSGPDIAKWDDSTDQNNWKHAAEVIAEEVLAINPNLLIVVEGVEAFPKEGYDYSNCGEFTTYCNWWGGNLRGVAKYPVTLSIHDRLVYSAHDYGPDIYMQPWFKKDFDKTTLYEECWQPNWFYIVEDNIAPVFIGEWGGKLENEINKEWLTALAEFMTENKIHHTFWSFNPNSADTGGLVGEDWKTVDEEKYDIIKPTLWMKGLDHRVPLGGKSPNAVVYGDVNGDGDFNSIDFAYMRQYLLGMISDFPVEDDLSVADVNGDGNIDSIDFGFMRQYLLGLITEFPVEIIY